MWSKYLVCTVYPRTITQSCGPASAFEQEHLSRSITDFTNVWLSIKNIFILNDSEWDHNQSVCHFTHDKWKLKLTYLSQICILIVSDFSSTPRIWMRATPKFTRKVYVEKILELLQKTLEFSLNRAELSLNSANSGNLRNHWGMIWVQYKDLLCCLCVCGWVVEPLSLTQEILGSNPVIFLFDF